MKNIFYHFVEIALDTIIPVSIRLEYSSDLLLLFRFVVENTCNPSTTQEVGVDTFHFAIQTIMSKKNMYTLLGETLSGETFVTKRKIRHFRQTNSFAQ